MPLTAMGFDPWQMLGLSSLSEGPQGQGQEEPPPETPNFKPYDAASEAAIANAPAPSPTDVPLINKQGGNLPPTATPPPVPTAPSPQDQGAAPQDQTMVAAGLANTAKDPFLRQALLSYQRTPADDARLKQAQDAEMAALTEYMSQQDGPLAPKVAMAIAAALPALFAGLGGGDMGAAGVGMEKGMAMGTNLQAAQDQANRERAKTNLALTQQRTNQIQKDFDTQDKEYNKALMQIGLNNQTQAGLKERAQIYGQLKPAYFELAEKRAQSQDEKSARQLTQYEKKQVDSESKALEDQVKNDNTIQGYSKGAIARVIYDLNQALTNPSSIHAGLAVGALGRLATGGVRVPESLMRELGVSGNLTNWSAKTQNWISSNNADPFGPKQWDAIRGIRDNLIKEYGGSVDALKANIRKGVNYQTLRDTKQLDTQLGATFDPYIRQTSPVIDSVDRKTGKTLSEEELAKAMEPYQNRGYVKAIWRKDGDVTVQLLRWNKDLGDNGDWEPVNDIPPAE